MCQDEALTPCASGLVGQGHCLTLNTGHRTRQDGVMRRHKLTLTLTDQGMPQATRI